MAPRARVVVIHLTHVQILAILSQQPSKVPLRFSFFKLLFLLFFSKSFCLALLCRDGRALDKFKQSEKNVVCIRRERKAEENEILMRIYRRESDSELNKQL